MIVGMGLRVRMSCIDGWKEPNQCKMSLKEFVYLLELITNMTKLKKILPTKNTLNAQFVLSQITYSWASIMH